MTLEFRIGDEKSCLTGRLTEKRLPSSPEFGQWFLTAESEIFTGTFEAWIPDELAARFFQGLANACHDGRHGESLCRFGEDRCLAATVTVYWQDGEVSHAVADLTPHGTDPIPKLSYWLNVDAKGLRMEAERVLKTLPGR